SPEVDLGVLDLLGELRRRLRAALLVLIELERLVVARAALLQRFELVLDVAHRFVIVLERPGARIVDVALAHVGGKQRAIAARLFARRRFLLGRFGLRRRLLSALLLLAFRVDASHDQAVRVHLLDRPADALHRNGGAIVFLAVVARTAVGGLLRLLRIGEKRRDEEYCGGYCFLFEHRVPPRTANAAILTC